MTEWVGGILIFLAVTFLIFIILFINCMSLIRLWWTRTRYSMPTTDVGRSVIKSLRDRPAEWTVVRWNDLRHASGIRLTGYKLVPDNPMCIKTMDDDEGDIVLPFIDGCLISREIENLIERRSEDRKDDNTAKVLRGLDNPWNNDPMIDVNDQLLLWDDQDVEKAGR